MLVDEIRNIKSLKKDLRKFGIIVGAVFAMFAALLLCRQKTYYYWLFVPAATFLLPGLLLPAVLKPVHKIWMTVAIIMSWIVTQITLTALFYLVVTPIGLLGRLVCRDFIDLKFDRNAKTYWIPREEKQFTKEDYEKQF